MPPSVLVLEPTDYSDAALREYGRFGPVSLGMGAANPEAVEVLVVRLGHFIGPELLNQLPALKLVVSPTTGTTHLDLAQLKERGVHVLTLRDASQGLERITSTGELTLGLIISLVRRLPEAFAHTRHGGWDRDRFTARQLSSLRLGLVGLGRIGGYMARVGRAMGMECAAYDPHIDNGRFESLDCPAMPLSDLVEWADVISIHADLRPDNHGLISREVLLRVRPGAMLVNTARGELLDEEAVVEALEEGRLSGVAVDVLDHELHTHRRESSPLLRMTAQDWRVLVSPHIGGASTDAMRATEEMMAREALRYLNEEAPKES
ncbi:MAG: NAD(P)-dependent oxidoreductase [Gemmatimonadota bacterium]